MENAGICKMFLLSVGLIIIACNNKHKYQNSYFELTLNKNWAPVHLDLLKLSLKKDGISLDIRTEKEETVGNLLLFTPEEYIKNEDANLLSHFVFFGFQYYLY